MTVKKYSVSVSITGKVRANIFLHEIAADSESSAMSRAISKVYVSGMLPPRICALLKEAERRAKESKTILKEIHGVEIYVWAVEDKDGGEVESK